MCNHATMQVIEQVIKDKMNNEEMFTAYNVSREVQNRGVNERHRHIKNDVHRVSAGLMSRYDYDSELTDIDGGIQAIVYFPISADPSSFNSIESNPARKVPVTSDDDPFGDGNVPVSVGGIVNATAPDDSDDKYGDMIATTVRVSSDSVNSRLLYSDARGRVCVPASYLRDIGVINAGIDIVAAIIDSQNHSVTVKKASDVSDLHNVICYQIDKSNNLRIPPATIRKAGIFSDVIAEVDKNVIVIREMRNSMF